MMPEARYVSITEPLTTTRLVLRPYERDDLALLHDMFGREEICRYLPWPPMDIDAARAKLEQRLRQTRIAAEGDPIVLAAIEPATGRYVGEFMLRLNSAQRGWPAPDHCWKRSTEPRVRAGDGAPGNAA